MTILNAIEASTKLTSLINEVKQTHQPIIIRGEKNNAVLLSEDDWRAMTETLYLLAAQTRSNDDLLNLSEQEVQDRELIENSVRKHKKVLLKLAK
jgi:prevent-host-death family protein